MHVPCYAGMHTLNGNGEVTGAFQIKDWGFTNTPLALTNSCSLGIVYHTIWQHTLALAKARGDAPRQLSRAYGTPVVGETADWWLNDVHDSALPASVVHEALRAAYANGGQREVLEGQHGGGAGMTCHMFPGGTGTSSRLVDGERDGATVAGRYTVGVICQSNYGHKPYLTIGGVPVGKLLVNAAAANEAAKEQERSVGGKLDDGSIVIYIMCGSPPPSPDHPPLAREPYPGLTRASFPPHRTDAPMLPHQLVRLAQRAGVGLAQVGGHNVGRNSSGDIFLALSSANATDEKLAGPTPDHRQPRVEINEVRALKNESIDALFRAASEATEEAILNSIVAGRQGRVTWDGNFVEGLPVDEVRELLAKYLIKV
ncbi:MAG: hypothetical protein M1818_004236 [Claussenomyces sp. TS43310]|nr:MAG: hypothetical protein M1818_004236 [Claussenomyces sp. TS43310]